jgi:hypothetical protein
MSSSKDKITAKDLDPSEGKGRVTMYVDLDVLHAVKEEAGTLKIGYQTYINQILREFFINGEKTDESVTKYLLSELKTLKKDVSNLRKKNPTKKLTRKPQKR